jgi:hypothetical protein
MGRICTSKTQVPPSQTIDHPHHFRNKRNLWMQKMISNVDADFVLFKNLCPKTIEGNEKGA